MEKSQRKEAQIECELFTGVFSSEFSVLVPSSEGRLSIFVDRGLVEVTREPRDDEPGRGRLRVSVLDKEDERALVRLPIQSSSTSSSIWVPSRLLEGTES